MSIVPLDDNRPASTPTRTLPPLPRKWLLGAGYTVLAIGLLLALAFIAKSRNGGDGHYAAYVTNGSGGMVRLISAPGPAEVNKVASEAAVSNPASQLVSSGEDRPLGPPTDPTRSDWLITKDYAAHGGPGPYGAVDFAFFHDKDAFGSPLHATHAGMIKTLKDDPIYGNLVYVIGKDYTTTYAHMQKITVTDGQMVHRGDKLGEMGSTGNSTGPHVDYQTWSCSGDPKASGTAARVCANKNPMDYLK